MGRGGAGSRMAGRAVRVLGAVGLPRVRRHPSERIDAVRLLGERQLTLAAFGPDLGGRGGARIPGKPASGLGQRRPGANEEAGSDEVQTLPQPITPPPLTAMEGIRKEQHERPDKR